MVQGRSPTSYHISFLKKDGQAIGYQHGIVTDLQILDAISMIGPYLLTSPSSSFVARYIFRGGRCEAC